MSSEQTYERDLDDPDEILRELLRLSDRTAGRLRSKGLCGRTVAVKVRFSSFKTVVRSKTLEEHIDTTPELYDVARDVYLRLTPAPPRVRLLGVGVSGLAPGPPKRQLGLLDGRDARSRWAVASKAVDAIRDRFGEQALAPASLLPRDD